MKRPRCPHPFAIRPDFPATTRIEHQVSTPNKKGGLRAQWLIYSPRSVPQHDRSSDTPFTFQEGSRVLCLNTRRWLTPQRNLYRTPRSKSELERNTEFHASTRDEALVPCTNSRGIQRGPSQLKRILDLPKTRSEAPSGPVASPGNPNVLSQLEKDLEIAPSM